MVTDTVADLLTRIRNAQTAGHASVKVPGSKLCKSVLDVMLEEGFIEKIDESQDRNGFKEYEVRLKFFADGKPLISYLKKVSKPGCRVYSRVQDFEKVKSGLGTALISTPQGVLTDRAAREQNVGGEVLAIIG